MNYAGAIGILFCFGIVSWFFGYVMNVNGYNAGYDEGWRDCERAHKYFEQTEDDEKVLKEMRKATKKHIRQTGAYRWGDMKVLDKAENIGDLKLAVHDICVLRKEQQ